MTTVPIIAVTRDDIAEPLVDEWAGDVDPRMWDLFAEPSEAVHVCDHAGEAARVASR